MKTLHRAAYETLTLEEYKRFCRIPTSAFIKKYIECDWTDCEHACTITFWRSNDYQDAAYNGYWELVDDKVKRMFVLDQLTQLSQEMGLYDTI